MVQDVKTVKRVMEKILKQIVCLYGWMFVRPRRWFFRKMIVGGSCPRWWFERSDIDRKVLYWPNIHWYVLYLTVFKFFKWLSYEAWRPLCKSERGWIKHKPLLARIIHRIGETTAGYVICGFECFHCGSKEGCQIELSEDETGEMFVLEDSGSEATPDGTNYWFCGTTICPVCGYRSQYHGDSL